MSRVIRLFKTANSVFIYITLVVSRIYRYVYWPTNKLNKYERCPFFLLLVTYDSSWNEISCLRGLSKKEKNVIVILSTITVMFILCNFPQAILRIMNKDEYSQNAPFQIFRLVCNLTEFLNASVNFLIYFLCNRQIREEVTRLLRKGKKQIFATESARSIKHKKVRRKKERMFEVIS